MHDGADRGRRAHDARTLPLVADHLRQFTEAVRALAGALATAEQPRRQQLRRRIAAVERAGSRLGAAAEVLGDQPPRAVC